MRLFGAISSLIGGIWKRFLVVFLYLWGVRFIKFCKKNKFVNI